MTRVAFLADLHAGETSHNFPLGNGQTMRERELYEVVEGIMRAVSKVQPDAVVFPGDVFHNLRPHPWAYKAVKWLLNELHAFAIEVICVGGNHDSGALADFVSPLGIVFRLSELVTVPRSVEVGDMNLICVPWFSRVHAAARMNLTSTSDQHEVMRMLLSSTVRELCSNEPQMKNVLVTHFMFSGARYNSDTQPLLGESSEFMVPLNLFDDSGLDLIVAGHVHRTQMIDSGGVPVYYPGSLLRHDFGEEFHKPVMLVVDSDETHGYTVKQFSVEGQVPFVTVDVRFDGGEYTAANVQVQDAVVRLKGTLPVGPQTQAFIADQTRKLLDAGAVRVSKPAIKFERHEVRRVLEVTAATSPAEALDKYIEAVGGDYETAHDDLLALHSRLFEEVTQGAGDDC